MNFLKALKNGKIALPSQIFLLGDMFDFWFEYKKVVPKGYVRILGQLARMTDMGIKIDFFCGNHDLWQRNYFEKDWEVEFEAS